MKKKNMLIIAVLILLLMLGSLVYLSKSWPVFRSKSVEPQKEAAAEHQGHTASPEQQVHSQAEEEEASEEVPEVEISPEQQRMIGVKTAEVKIQPLKKTIRTVGRIEYNEKNLFTVNTKIEGWIEKLHIDYTGRYVKKGEPLAEIYSPELIATQQEYLNALKWKTTGSSSKGQVAGEKDAMENTFSYMLSKDSEKMIEAAKQRLNLWDISDSQIKKIEETGRPLRTLTVFSPVSGYVLQKMALQGMKVMPGEKLFDIADLSSLWIISDVYEYEMSFIKTGQTAKIELSYFPSKKFNSKIDYVYPSLAGDTRTAKIRFTVPNQDGSLKPQMFTNVEIEIDLGKRLAIPEDAIIDTGTRQVVYVDKGDGYFEPREVMIGLKAEGMKEVLMGLKAGERVVSAATFLIDSEAQLKNVIPLGGHKH